MPTVPDSRAMGTGGRVWMIGPESKVYHRDFNCAALKGHRYYAAIRYSLAEAQRRGRRPCKRCSK